MIKLTLTLSELQERCARPIIEIGSLSLFSEARRSFAAGVEKKRAYKNVCALVTRCRGCTTARSRVYIPTLGFGDVKSRHVFVGRNPTYLEGKIGYPFPVGTVRGTLFGRLLNGLGLERESCYTMFSMRCGLAGDRRPSQHDVEKCGYWTTVEFRTLQCPEIIYLLGVDAVRSVIGLGVGGIMDCIGQFYKYRVKEGDTPLLPAGHELWLIPMVHPVGMGLGLGTRDTNTENNHSKVVREHVRQVKALVSSIGDSSSSVQGNLTGGEEIVSCRS